MRRLLVMGVVVACMLTAAPALATPGYLEIPPATPAAPHVSSHQAQAPALWTQTLYGVMPQDAGLHRLVVWCSGDALVYSLSLYMPAEGNKYDVKADSIRLSGVVLDHAGYSAEGDLWLDVLRGADIRLNGGALPLVIPEHGSLMIPVEVTGERAAARIVVDATYVAGHQTTCGLDSFEPGMVGAFFPADTFGGLMQESVGAGVADFNSYLEDMGADWRLEPDVYAGNVTQAIGEMQEGGIRTYLGFPASGGLLELAAGDTPHLAVSCCATLGSLDKDDRIFRTAPSDTRLGLQLARLVAYNEVDVLLPVWRPHDVWETGYVDSVSDAFYSLGGMVDGGVAADADEDPAGLAARIVDRIDTLAGIYGADKVAVFVAIYEEEALLYHISQYAEVRDVRWFGTDYTVGKTVYTAEGSVPEFASAVGYAALQVGVSEMAVDVISDLEAVTGRPANHDMLAAYESAWILGLAMAHAQTSDPERLAGTMPHVAERHTGSLGPMTLDHNGDLAADSFEVWQVRSGEWTLAGVME